MTRDVSGTFRGSLTSLSKLASRSGLLDCSQVLPAKVISSLFWNHEINRLMADRDLTPNPLRLILGVGRSGTSWVLRVASTARSPMRVISEPLHHLRPRLRIGVHRDHTAIGFGAGRYATQPLLRAYSLLASPGVDLSRFGLDSSFVIREDEAWKICLVKEVHGLLGTETLLERIPAMSAIFLLRSPLYIVDSLLSAQGVETPYLVGESKHVMRAPFRDRFMDGISLARDEHEAGAICRRRVIPLIDTVWAVRQMFRQLAREYPDRLLLMSYEEICESPNQRLRDLCEFLSLEWTRASEAEIRITTAGVSHGQKLDPYGTERHTANQVGRPFRVLTEAEVDYCHHRLLSLDEQLRRKQ